MKRSFALEIGLFLFTYIASAGAVWYGMDLHWKRVNTPEVVAQRKVNKSIRADLCDRVKRDLTLFKETPLSFRRTTLKTLEMESRASLRRLLTSEGVPTDFPVEYTETTSRFAGCEPEIRSWLQIPSTDSKQLASEYASTGVKPPESARTGNESPASVVMSARNGRRIALVIGNAAYENRPLINPVNDADDMAAALGKLGFEVINLRNAKFQELRNGVEQYLKRLHGSDVGLIYFSGHGVEYAGRNYMLPVDLRADQEDEIPRQAIDLTVLVDKVSKVEGKVNIVIMDACRSSFVVARSRNTSQGLSPMPAVSGTLVAYSTAPGAIALDGANRNSPYTESLLRTLNRPGLKIEQVFKETAKLVAIQTGGRQNPWYSSSLSTEFSLH